MKSLSFILLMGFFSFSVSANNYYPDSLLSADNKNVEDFKSELRQTISRGHKEVGYADARRHLFGNLHLKNRNGRYQLTEVYCGITYNESSGIGENKVPNPNVVNTEHTWPQSRFSSNFPKNLQKGDLHHLFPTNSKANSERSSNPFGEVIRDRMAEGCDESKLGSVEESNSDYFEPPTNHKGNVARAIFYFSVRYNLKVSEIEERYLREWNELDPVDADERARNEGIFRIQNNRNPFVDHPEFVNRISDF